MQNSAGNHTVFANRQLMGFACVSVLRALGSARSVRAAVWSFLFSLGASIGLSQTAISQQKLYSASIGRETTYIKSIGDTWYATWADDGDLYVTSDDTTGWSGNCKTSKDRPEVFVAVSRIHGDDPSKLEGETVNCMDAYDVSPDLRPEHSWKTTGIISVGGVLYLTVEQDIYGDSANGGRETAHDATIIKSLDHGKTWSGAEAESVARPMFPGRTFGTPSFIQYGRDGAGGADGGDKYIYAISNDGSWDNGNSIVLGRVRRDDLSQLRGSDWEFYADGIWTHDAGKASPILREPDHLSSSSAIYDSKLGMYLIASWYYPGCSGYAAPGCDVHRSRWVWYQAPKPWGPWTKFQEFDWFPAGYYNPSLLNKFLSDDGLTGWVLSAGYFLQRDWYFFTAAPFILDKVPTTIVNDSDTRSITYKGAWEI